MIFLVGIKVEYDGGGDDHGDGEEESFYEDGEGGEEEKDEDDVSLVPRNGGQYAHEIFWPAFSLARKGKYADVTDWLDKGMEGDVSENGKDRFYPVADCWIIAF